MRNGAPGRIRTSDLVLRRHTLYLDRRCRLPRLRLGCVERPLCRRAAAPLPRTAAALRILRVSSSAVSVDQDGATRPPDLYLDGVRQQPHSRHIHVDARRARRNSIGLPPGIVLDPLTWRSPAPPTSHRATPLTAIRKDRAGGNPWLLSPLDRSRKPTPQPKAAPHLPAKRCTAFFQDRPFADGINGETLDPRGAWIGRQSRWNLRGEYKS